LKVSETAGITSGSLDWSIFLFSSSGDGLTITGGTTSSSCSAE